MVRETWKYLDSGILDAATNMAIDESLLNWHSEGFIPPVLRLYGWEKPSLSIGQFQKAEKSIDFDGIAKHGCEFVRRLTGGSAVLHDDELTYSIIVSEDHPNIPQSVQKAYYILSKGVLEGYHNLGINADYAIPEREAMLDKTAVCFEKTAVYEMIVDGKKISGNAQTRKKGVLLQHGSIPITMDEDMLFDLFKFKTERARERQRNNFSNKAVSIEQITQKPHTYDMLKAAFLDGFKKGLNIEVEPFTLSAEQWAEVHELADTKYRSDEWNLRRFKERVHHG
ncbi:lipoate--protein ligase family protein [Aciduricibacillus chroicocephali]|uniref:Lipoate--protein ligase family protein n=1 Tax=Aciduricibacillus chroicocephali TaxID=3054939 RepID=A0ABY9KWC9_9BACI|nr:lipoate--protein ligase family protein [Bacillaceae bacterium 44XB]